MQTNEREAMDVKEACEQTLKAFRAREVPVEEVNRAIDQVNRQIAARPV